MLQELSEEQKKQALTAAINKLSKLKVHQLRMLAMYHLRSLAAKADEKNPTTSFDVLVSQSIHHARTAYEAYYGRG